MPGGSSRHGLITRDNGSWGSSWSCRSCKPPVNKQGVVGRPGGWGVTGFLLFLPAIFHRVQALPRQVLSRPKWLAVSERTSGRSSTISPSVHYIVAFVVINLTVS